MNNKYLNFFKNYNKLKNTKYTKRSLLRLVFKVFFEVNLIKVLQFFRLNNLVVKLVIKYNLIYSIRSVSLKNKDIISKTWKKYNQYNVQTDSKLIQEFREKGYCCLGKIFTDQQCFNFVKSLNNKYFYNSQQPLQSDGELYFFDDKNFKEKYNFNYFCFNQENFINFDEIKNFLQDKDSLFKSILNFDYKIYSALTWINLPTKKKHYVQEWHRDYDDFKFLTIIINWSDINLNNGATKYIEGSHKREARDGKKVHLEGKRGTVFLVDNYGLHSGNLPKESVRITSWLRLGKLENPASIQDGFVTTP